MILQIFNISLTPTKRGFSASIIQALGEMLISQLVNAYSASIVLSGEIESNKGERFKKNVKHQKTL